ncbi:hypothetical protein [Candidatus Poriferisodalis sp.]|uniref:hypothetical protein n=1 Tax=Candidatus Poriferisodalis sp. TaxID=3101277 RepID=UPI003B5A8152
MRVGAYIDGFNVYYGGRQLCGRDATGWRWLDFNALVRQLIARNRAWTAAGADVARIVYCTALVNGQIDPGARIRQKTYLNALRASGTVEIELGAFMTRTARGVDAVNRQYAEIQTQEEKGSDVN